MPALALEVHVLFVSGNNHWHPPAGKGSAISCKSRTRLGIVQAMYATTLTEALMLALASALGHGPECGTGLHALAGTREGTRSRAEGDHRRTCEPGTKEAT